MIPFVWWLFHYAGLDDVSGPWYAFYSGIAGDLGLFFATVVFAIHTAADYRHKNCHVRWCPRIGRHEIRGTSWKVCNRHHPGDSPTRAMVQDAHRRAEEKSR